MLYSEYIKILKDNNIKLFDHEKRISFYNINYFKFNNEQKGGGYLIENKNLKNIIDISLSSNPQNLLNLIN